MSGLELSEVERHAIDYVISYVGNTTNDWSIIKVQIVKNYPPLLRGRFTKRHRASYKMFVTEFDKIVMRYWEEKTGVTLFVDPNKLHNEATWVDKPHGWGLVKFNEERAKKRRLLEKTRQKENNEHSSK